jgi:hypothetical protein
VGCACRQHPIAYTYKTTSNRIYICSLFWSQSSSFRAHAVGHESYHWNTVAGADDVTYGSSQCQSLARTRPNDAHASSCYAVRAKPGPPHWGACRRYRGYAPQTPQVGL